MRLSCLGVFSSLNQLCIECFSTSQRVPPPTDEHNIVGGGERGPEDDDKALQPGAYAFSPAGGGPSARDVGPDIEVGGGGDEGEAVALSAEREERALPDPGAIEARLVADIKVATADPAWSRRKIVLASIALMLVAAGVAAVIVYLRVKDDDSVPPEPLPTFDNKQDLRIAAAAYVAGNMTDSPHLIGSWDVSNVTDFGELFAAYADDDTFLDFDEDISGWESK